MKKLENKVAIITGSSKGIGEGIAKVFAKYGARLMLVARSETVMHIAKEMSEQGYEVAAMMADVTKKEELDDVVEKTLELYGCIDILVNNAGVCSLEDFLVEGEENRDYHIDSNIKGVWNATKAVLPHMVEKKAGKIVIMSSVTGDIVADPGEAAYAMSKAALVGFTKAIAREFASSHINVNAICPGYVMTPMAESIAKQSCPENPESVIDGIASTVPLGRLAKPEEIGELAAFLSCSESDYITGTQIVIDGGSTLPETVSVGV